MSIFSNVSQNIISFWPRTCLSVSLSLGAPEETLDRGLPIEHPSKALINLQHCWASQDSHWNRDAVWWPKLGITDQRETTLHPCDEKTGVLFMGHRRTVQNQIRRLIRFLTVCLQNGLWRNILFYFATVYTAQNTFYISSYKFVSFDIDVFVQGLLE